MAEGSSPFNRSGVTPRSPPPNPAPRLGSAPELPPAPASQPSPATQPPPASRPAQHEDPPKTVSTQEIQVWLTSIEQHLNEVCHIATEGKLNSEQKLRISNLCRKVGHCTSQLAVEYQSIKQKAVQFYTSSKYLQEQVDFSQRVNELKQCITESTKPSQVPISFADVLKKNQTRFVQPDNISSVAIYPTDKQTSSEQTKTLVQKLIKPDEMNLHVRGLRKIKNGGVVISTESKDDILKLRQATQLSTSGLTVDEPLKRRPRVAIIGVPATMQEIDVFKCIYKQNLADKIPDMTYEKYLASTKLSHKSGRKGAETCNFILEVSAPIRKALISGQRVFVNWSSCPVRDFTLVTRCFKCQQYGHAAKSCKGEVDTCGHCGNVGHSIKDCTRKAEPAKCATCKHFNKPCDHETGDADCPARQLAEKRYINSIDYEGA